MRNVGIVWAQAILEHTAAAAHAEVEVVAREGGDEGGGVVIALVDATCEASVLGSMSAAGYRAFATDLPTRATS